MAKVYPINLNNPDDVILVDVTIKQHDCSLVLDTGATNTIIDLNSLLIAGYSINLLNSKPKKFETANGIIEANSFIVRSIVVFDSVFNDVQIFTLDFIQAGIVSGYEGVLGLDILKQFNVHLNFLDNNLTIS